MKAIETRYNGHRFRSRTEARWAVFFDTAGIPYEYEPEGFMLGDGIQYLPDFYLPTIDVWFEVKGHRNADLRKPWLFQERLADERGHGRVVVAYGQMPDPATLEPAGHPEDVTIRADTVEPTLFDLEVSGDHHYAWCVCPWCGQPGIEFDARGARVCGWRKHYATEDEALDAIRHLGHWRADDKCYTGNHPTIVNAYAAARAARFEFGEKGTG